MRRRTRRPGVALLLVLAALVLATTACAGLARAAAAARLRAELSHEERIAAALLRAAEAPILDWLHRHAGRVVLPADAATPRFPVMDDTLTIAGDACRVTITAFDQCGMVSGTARFGPADATLPAVASNAIARVGKVFARRPGLDVLALGSDSDVYPACRAASEPCIGELVATHNPARPGAATALNVNTAPMPLVAAVCAARGVGIEAIEEARSAGRISSPGAAGMPAGEVSASAPLPVAMSTAWAFRIDCRAGRVVRSWWCVYVDSGSNWERVQRLAIDE